MRREEVLAAEAPSPGRQRLWYGSLSMLEQWVDYLDPQTTPNSK